MNKRPCLALLTDFGQQDAYVAIMKGLILKSCPDVQFIDISHQVPTGDIHYAAYQLKYAYTYFPEQTIFLVVVDPGVGSSRKPIAVQTNQYFFIAPDNGVLSWALEESQLKTVVHLQQYDKNTLSNTFHGRDIFAPCAAKLLQSEPMAQLGHVIQGYQALERPKPRHDNHSITGEVILADHFGNLITNIPKSMIMNLNKNLDQINLQIQTEHISGISKTYSDQSTQKLMALIGSNNHLEIALFKNSAQAHLKISPGTEIKLTSSRA